LAGDAAAQTIGVYKPGATKPFRTIETAPCAPYQFNFDRAGKNLYVACGTPAGIEIFDYATGSPNGTVSQGLSGFGYTLGVTLDAASK
jgi:hypothetical protein